MHIPLNNLIKLALGPSLIKYDNDSVQICKNENKEQRPMTWVNVGTQQHTVDIFQAITFNHFKMTIINNSFN